MLRSISPHVSTTAACSPPRWFHSLLLSAQVVIDLLVVLALFFLAAWNLSRLAPSGADEYRIAGLIVVQWMQPDANPFAAALLGAALFGGFAISFLLLYLFAGDHRKFAWALIMAGALAIFAAFLAAASFGESNLIVQIWPAVLILLGLIVLARLFTGRAAADKRPPPTVSAEVLEAKELGAGQGAEPARIVRPDPPSDSVPESVPSPAPASIAEPDAEPLPAEIATFDPNDPEAALDALLKASTDAAE